jgi:diaminohydroxyphosphoribosylaminopyrimidine deaminase/5-amino-6-(5-phosphoribosylamino)uracil reductase
MSRRSPADRWRDADARHLDRALELAARGRYGVSPNPMVGAVIVRGARVVGEAFHRRAGGPHAEIAALRRAGRRARGADLYLTLEPCVHHGRTPPCAPEVIAAGVSRVVIAARDPNPVVAGRGIAALRRAGISVVLAPERWRALSERLNAKFAVWVGRRRPYVLAKWAETLDGRIATSAGESRWITGPEARSRALALREEHDSVLVGAGTVEADDPRLTRRLGWNRAVTHWRIVLDGRLHASPGASVFRGPGPRAVATALPADHSRAKRLRARGVEVWSLPDERRGRVDLAGLLRELAARGVASLMVEGGARTLWEFFAAGLVDGVAVFVAPRVLGGERAIGAVGGRGFSLARAAAIEDARVESVGRDLLITGRVGGRTAARTRTGSRGARTK